MTFPGLLSFVSSPKQVFSSFSKQKSMALTTRTFSSASAPARFGLWLIVGSAQSSNNTCPEGLLWDNTLPSKFEGEMQELIFFCRCSQTHLMASITTFLNKCWGKGWKMWVLACGDWFCETLKRCHPRWPYDPGAPRLDCACWELKHFLCWPFAIQEMN